MYLNQHVSKSTIRSVTSSLASARAKEMAKLAELNAKASILEKREALQNEMEKLTLQEEIAVAQAREQVFAQADNDVSRNVTSYGDGMNEYCQTARLTAKGRASPREPDALSREPESVETEHLLKPSEAATRHDVNTEKASIPSPTFNNTRTPPVRRTIQIPKFSPLHSGSTFETPPPLRGRISRPNQPTFPPDDSLLQILEKQNKLTEILSDQHLQSLLPPLNLTAFKGDPTEYHIFIRTFEMRIESRLKTSQARLQYLKQHLQGEPKELIRGCLHMEPDSGYIESKRLLEEKYGDPYKVSNAYLTKVTNWPIIKSGDDSALDKFATFLTQCLNAMRSLSYLVILDHPQNLQCLVKKLPFFLQERWRREVTKIRESKKTPEFANFVNFIKAEVKVATDPVFSRQVLEKVGQDDKSKPRKGQVQKHISGITISGRPGIKPCILCNNMHDLDDCKRFAEKSLAQRRAFIMEKGLCYACYGEGHRSRGCLKRRSCKICSGRHPTALHDKNYQPPKDRQREMPARSGSIDSSTQTNDEKKDLLNSACCVATGTFLIPWHRCQSFLLE